MLALTLLGSASEASLDNSYVYVYTKQYFVEGAEFILRVVNLHRLSTGAEEATVAAGPCINKAFRNVTIRILRAPSTAIHTGDVLIYGTADVRTYKAGDLSQIRHLTPEELVHYKACKN